MQQYKISVKTVTDKIFTYTVDTYEIVDRGAFIEFYDEHDGRMRRYPVQNCQIIVIGGDE